MIMMTSEGGIRVSGNKGGGRSGDESGYDFGNEREEARVSDGSLMMKDEG